MSRPARDTGDRASLTGAGTGPSLSAPSPGETRLTLGKYTALLRVGRGGMAEVFVAVLRGHMGFHKLVVLKRLHGGVADDEQYRAMFLEEARLAARLNHPNVVQTHEVSEHDGALYLAMEYLEGQPLNRLRKRLAKDDVPMPEAMAARIVADVLAGLHYAHELRDFDGTPLRVIHRDVSPQNIFVTYEGQVKLLDFGIAKAERAGDKTQAGVLKGKAGYMAPEQLTSDTIDRRVDVFTAGAVLWGLLAGQPLMNAASTAQTLMKLMNEPIPKLSSVVPTVDKRLDAIVERSLARNPNDRYATAADMRDALLGYLAEGSQDAGAHENLGDLVTSLFGDERRVQDELVREQLALSNVTPISAPMSVTGMRAVSEVDIDEPRDESTSRVRLTPDEPGAAGVSASFLGVGVTKPPPEAETVAPPGLRRRFRMSYGIVLGVSAAALLVLVARTVGVSDDGGSRGAASSGVAPIHTPSAAHVVSREDPGPPSAAGPASTVSPPPAAPSAPVAARAAPDPRVFGAKKAPAPMAAPAGPKPAPPRPSAITQAASPAPAAAPAVPSQGAAPEASPARGAQTPSETPEGRRFRLSL